MIKEIDWLVVPGGPGISKSYLQIPLDEAVKGTDIKLHYYDPYGTPEGSDKPNLQLSDLVDQIYQEARKRGLRRFGIISHSFGTFLALRFAEKHREMLSALIFLSPMPLLHSLWIRSLSIIQKGVPESKLRTIEQESLKAETNDGSVLFDLLFPFYSFLNNIKLPRIPFRIKICNDLSSQVTPYDDTARLEQLNIPVACVVGDKDPFYYPGMFPYESTVVLKDVGHYPFFENLEQFTTSLVEVDKKLCQRRKQKITM